MPNLRRSPKCIAEINCPKLEIRPLTFHTLRHPFISLACRGVARQRAAQSKNAPLGEDRFARKSTWVTWSPTKDTRSRDARG